MKTCIQVTRDSQNAIASSVNVSKSIPYKTKELPSNACKACYHDQHQNDYNRLISRLPTDTKFMQN